MPTISAKIINKPRVIRFCDHYRHNLRMAKGEPCMRIFGSAFSRDPPYALYMCLKCAREEDDPKIIKALMKYEGGEAEITEEAEWTFSKCPRCGHELVARDRYGLFCCFDSCGWSGEAEIKEGYNDTTN